MKQLTRAEHITRGVFMPRGLNEIRSAMWTRF